MNSNDAYEKVMDALFEANVRVIEYAHTVLEQAIQTTAEWGEWVAVHRDEIASAGAGTNSSVSMSASPSVVTNMSVFDRIGSWIVRNKGKIVMAAVVTSVGVSAYAVHAQSQRRKRARKARRAANGVRIEAVVVASSPREPIAKLIAADLEQRGFVVYVTAQAGEEHLVLKEDSSDIRPLIMPAPDSAECEGVVTKFANMIDRKQHLAGVIIVPDLYYPTGPAESISAYDWSDIFYSKLVRSVGLFSQGFVPLVRRHSAKFILLTPSILSSLCPPFHAPECVTASALSAFAVCMNRELAPQGVQFVHMRLGAFDMSVPVPSAYSPSYSPAYASPSITPTAPRGARSYSPATSASAHRSVSTNIRADLLSWPDHIRRVYGKAYSSAVCAINRTRLGQVRGLQNNGGSPVSELHHAVFDALTGDRTAAVQFVGQGSYLYYVLGCILPELVMGWVIGSISRDDEGFPSVNEHFTPESPLSSAVSECGVSESDTSHDLGSSWERV
ncbi:hypothetical protein V1512DRAFT_54442 [Lipomyces arxii]|uniref:uncharacterized protein n=1 Tax=Lipomyces arxii TaxID=56418 RepID=UPI0034CDB13F